MLRMVREVDPPRPSTRLGAANDLPNVAANRSIEPVKLAKLFQGELDWVVMKALEKDRDRRYDTVNGLARDVERYLADEAVEVLDVHFLVGGAGVAFALGDVVPDDGAVEVIAAPIQGELRQADALHDPEGLDVGDVVEHQAGDGEGL